MAPFTSPKLLSAYFLFILAFIVLCAGLSVGLTFAPCYDSLCVEQFHPFQARLHIALYYTLLATIAVFLAARVLFTSLDRFATASVVKKKVPLICGRLSVGGLILGIAIAMLSFGSIGYWLPVEYAWWEARGASVGLSVLDMHNVAWTGITGHWLDIWIGLVIIPISRNSILGKVFRLHVSTMLSFHKLLSYALFVGALIHGIFYFTFVAVLAVAPAIAKNAILVDNPTISTPDAKTKIPRSYLVLPTGIITFALILVILITSLPVLRMTSYNVFYFTHITLAIGILILTCIHASTNFYFLLPGIFLWIGDWILRVHHSLKRTEETKVENAGNGWYRIRLAQRKSMTSLTCLEKGSLNDMASASETPLATYYINVPAVSKFQIHPFTAAATASATEGPIILFRQAPERKKESKTQREWTSRVGAIADLGLEQSTTSMARIEGPYLTVIPEIFVADHYLLLVGGSGVTGALSISNWWALRFGSTTSREKTLRLVWTIRSPHMTQVYEFQQLQALMRTQANMDITIHVSSEVGHLNCGHMLDETISTSKGGGHIWLYASGPDGLLADVEDACCERGRRPVYGRGSSDSGKEIELSWYIARWTT